MDIVPIQLSLTAGDLITLWAPRWREHGDEWEGFLGDEDALHAFPDAAALAAYVRTVPEHDLAEHPSWPLVLQLSAPELIPDEDHCYDLVGVPEIMADEPDTWTVSELAGITTLVRSLADTCGLDAVHDVLNAAEGFALLERGTWAFHGRDGARLWAQLAEVIATRWDEVIDVVDAVVVVPEVDPDALARARRELVEDDGVEPDGDEPGGDESGGDEPGGDEPGGDEPGGHELHGEEAEEPDDTEEAPEEVLEEAEDVETGLESDASAFWESVGIDPILISLEGGEHYTLSCYLDDKPVFLGARGRIHTLPTTEALVEFLAGAGADGHDLAGVSTWPEVVTAASAGELAVPIDPRNNYQLTGLGEDLAAGPTEVDPHQLDLGVELLLDVGEWAGDEEAALALRPSQSLGWLTSFVLRPDPTRLAPSPPFDAEAARWDALVAGLSRRLQRPT